MLQALFILTMIVMTLIAVSIITYCVKKIKKEFKLKRKDNL